MTRQGRLSSARATRWVENYRGKSIIKSYKKWFAVDPLCAITELRMLGVKISAERENQIKTSMEARSAARTRRQKLAVASEFEEVFTESDGTFAYIAGYTPGGAPFGVTWEELGEEPPWSDDGEDGIKPAAPRDRNKSGVR
ncbi:MAG: hypothetical protein HY695_11625 [Deltaproteobacteria bacterium]|nr:hypothetical protein [Deltaproteobacteria bacterium]